MANHKQRYDWEKIRAEYETGSTQSDLCRRHNVSRKAIQKHIAAENWTQDVNCAINRLADAKVAGLVAGCDPKKKAEALDKAAEAKATVITRHKQEWEEHKALIQKAINEEDEKTSFDYAKIAKIIAETIKIRQEGERKAWGISDQIQKPEIEVLPLFTLPPGEVA